MTENDKRTLQNVLRIMEENDPNGDYMTYLDDIENGALQLAEVVTTLLAIIKQWRIDLNAWRDPKQSGLRKLENSLASLI